MLKKYKKLIAISMLSALVLVVGGFCNVGQVSASISKSAPVVHVSGDGCQTEVQEKEVVSSLPMPTDSLMPCCVERPEKTPSTSASNSIGIMKLAVMDSSSEKISQIYFSENILNSSLDFPPPKPDKLSSVLRLE